MNKILNISLATILAVLPVVSYAANVDKSPITDSDAEATTNVPKYALAVSTATDNAVATTGYVKGAYNAAIKAINAIPDSVVETINHADVTGNATIDLTGVSVTGSADIDLENATISGEISNEVTQGSVEVPIVTAATGTVGTVTEWGVDAVNGTAPVAVNLTSGTQNVSVSGTEVHSTLVSASISGATAGTVSLGLTGDATVDTSGLSVSVDGYHHVPTVVVPEPGPAPEPEPNTGD